MFYDYEHMYVEALERYLNADDAFFFDAFDADDEDEDEEDDSSSFSSSSSDDDDDDDDGAEQPCKRARRQ